MKRNEEKGGRKARKAQRVARSKPSSGNGPSAPPFVAVIQELTLELQARRLAIADALHFYDRAVGNVREDCGFTAADVHRLEEIRKLAI